LHFLEAAKALALVRGRNYVIDEDLTVLAVPVLVHRIRLRDPKAQGEKLIREICLARTGGLKTGELKTGSLKTDNPKTGEIEAG
jgi:MoxR-like ATPase